MTAADRFARLAALQPAADHEPPGPIVVPRLVAGWLAAGPCVATGPDRADLEALCRQIDVRHRVSATYLDGWKRTEGETSVAPATLAGLVAVLLANAGELGDERGPDDQGWGLKCANSALKALELVESIPAAAELRAWAVAVLDDRSRPAPSTAGDGAGR